MKKKLLLIASITITALVAFATIKKPMYGCDLEDHSAELDADETEFDGDGGEEEICLRRADNENYGYLNEEAIAHYSRVIALTSDTGFIWDRVRAYLGKGDVMMRIGEVDSAKYCYHRVLELDSVPEINSVAMFAYLALGENEKAVAFMDSVMQQDTTYMWNFYNKACLYSRLGDIDKSLENLDIALDKGVHMFTKVRTDTYLEAARKDRRFFSLVRKYERIDKQRNGQFQF
jgi:tetratricopeptide (TPR) repeat protein